jgi:hypothetical protein
MRNQWLISNTVYYAAHTSMNTESIGMRDFVYSGDRAYSASISDQQKFVPNRSLTKNEQPRFLPPSNPLYTC